MKTLLMAVLVLCASTQAHGAEDTSLALIKKCEKIVRYGNPHEVHGPSVSDAIVALGLLGDERAVEVLGETLENHANATVRMNSARALGWIKSDKAVPYLEKALTDKYRHTKEAAAKSLFAITGKKPEIVYTKEDLEELRQFREEVERLDAEDDKTKPKAK